MQRITKTDEMSKRSTSNIKKKITTPNAKQQKIKKEEMTKKYLWSYKCVILDYLSLQNMKMPDKIVYDSSRYTDHRTKYKVRIKTKLFSRAHDVVGFDDDAQMAEYKAFFNLYERAMREASN